MAITIDIIALFVEVVSKSVIPLLFSIVREVVYAFVLQLERELVCLAVFSQTFICFFNKHLLMLCSIRCNA